MNSCDNPIKEVMTTPCTFSKFSGRHSFAQRAVSIAQYPQIAFVTPDLDYNESHILPELLKSRQQLISVNGMNLHRLPMIRKSSRKTRRSSTSGKQLNYEVLEPRLAMAAEDLIDFTAIPSGALEGKIVYTGAGHGWEYLNGNLTTNRGDVNEIVEPFGNQDQMTYFADYLLRAGATVAPMRPIGHQFNEVVLDNDSAGVSFSGTWTNSTASVYYDEDYGATADTVSYQFASVGATETATATYTPNIPEAGYYPIYTWVADGANRTDQLYRINHSGGGVAEIRVDHRMVGKGWVYLGTYYFEEGSSGNVVISNESTEGGVVVADTIRFGNGMGDLKGGVNGVGHPSGSITGKPREDEASLLWVWRAIGQGHDPASIVLTSNISAPHLMAEHMNADTNPFGTSVYISFHSNASETGNARGAIGLINSSASARTPHQSELALYTGRQINLDMQSLNGQFEHNWSNRTTHTLSASFGEIDAGPGAEMDMTIIETAYHDNVEDAELMRDPKVRDQLGRSTYEAVLEYFDNFGNNGGLADVTSVPSAPTSVTATTDAEGNITVAWAPGVIGVQGGAPTAYRVYVSRDGYGYVGYVEVAGGGAGSYTFDAADLGTETLYFKVVAVNSGGESRRSSVVAARPQNGGEQRILVVDGFDRLDRAQNERYAFPPGSDGLTDRVRDSYSNSRDYVIQYGEALAMANASIDTASNEAVISGAINLSDYQAVIWILGEESTADDTFNSVEVSLVSNYLASGGQLFATGSELAFEFGAGNTFLTNQLHVNYVSDDANTYNVNGATGSIFEGLSFSFDNGAQFYNVDFPDVITPANGSTVALNYSTGTTAGIQYDGGPAGPRVVMFGFPVETITNSDTRNQVIARVLGFFDFELEFQDVDLVLDNDDGPAVYTETGTWTLSGGTGYNGGTYKFSPVGSASTATWQFFAPFAGQGEVFVQYVAGSNRASSTTYQIETGNGTENVSIDQKSNSLTWISLGNFDFTAGNHTIVLNAATSSGGSVVIADAVRVVIPVPVNENADFDGDGDVDGRDFLQWQRGFGITGTATQSQGDANNDSDVDAADLAIWQSQYEGSQAIGQVAAAVVSDSPDEIPEPDLLTLSGITDLNTSLFSRRATNLNSSRAYVRHAEPFSADSGSSSNPLTVRGTRTSIAELENSQHKGPLKRGDAEMLQDLAIEELMLSEFR
jgi:hypothetical protein